MAIKKTQTRVLTLCYEHPPLGGGGGKVARGLIDRLCPKGFDVDLVTMRLPEAISLQHLPNLAVYQINVRRRDEIVCTPLEMLPYIALSFWRCIRLVRANRYDFNLSHFLFPDGVVCLALKKLFGLPYVITAHGSDVPGYNPHRFKFLHLLLKPVWRTVAQNAATIVCPSQVVQDLVKDGCPTAHTVVIPNGIEPTRFVHDADKLPRILVVSRMVERKGVQFLIEALAGLDHPFQLHVVGDGPYLPTLRQLARHHGIDVVFHGAIANDSPAMSELYETSRIFAFVSTMENFPLVLLEAMTAGCAIVTTSSTGCAEVVGNDAILVPPADVEATRGALVQLMNDPSLCATMGKNARARVEKLYSWDIVVDRYLQTLEATVKQTSATNSCGRADQVNAAPLPPS